MKLKSKPNFTEGPLFFRITAFAIPIMLTGLLQIAYSMADNIVVGKFSGDPGALAAVGSTGSLTNLIINLLFGIGAGAGVVVSQFYGAGESERVSKSVHTAMLFSLLGGIAAGALGVLISRPALVLLGTKPEVLDGATLYLRIICLGIPANAIYNFGASILRGCGNSRAPLFILAGAGAANVILNIFFVVACHMSVAGVATATIISQYISAVLVVYLLMREKDAPYAIKIRELGISRPYLARILRFGVPAGVASSMFAIANVLMTSAVNSFDTATVTANTIASNIDSLTLTSMSCFGQASMTFTGQNFGANKPERIKKSVSYCLIQVFTVGVVVSALELIFARGLISLYLDKSLENAAVIEDTAITIMIVMLSTYFLCGLLDTVSGGLKGLGYTMTSMIINLVLICGFRMLWILGIFPRIGGIVTLFLAYPISWLLAFITAVIFFILAYRKFKRTLALPDSDSVSKVA